MTSERTKRIYINNPATIAECGGPCSIGGPELCDCGALYRDVSETCVPKHPGDFARSGIARFGHQPAPAAEGDVEDLVSWLKENADDERQMSNGDNPASRNLDCAAELLEQRHPVPVPVSEGLPKPKDCDGEGRCWGYHPHNSEDDDIWHSWSLVPAKLLPSTQNWIGWNYWLPANALPLPANDVQA